MASRTYALFREAILNEKQIVCTYDGLRREICPLIVGRNHGTEKALVFQFAGGSRSGLPPGGEWKCLTLDKVTDATLRDGPWHEGSGHAREQSCVDDVDLDVNIHVRRRRG
jgi:hypothetical protein